MPTNNCMCRVVSELRTLVVWEILGSGVGTLSRITESAFHLLLASRFAAVRSVLSCTSVCTQLLFSHPPTVLVYYSEVDLIIWCPGMRPAVLAIDATVVSPTLPCNLADTLKAQRRSLQQSIGGQERQTRDFRSV